MAKAVAVKKKARKPLLLDYLRPYVVDWKRKTIVFHGRFLKQWFPLMDDVIVTLKSFLQNFDDVAVQKFPKNIRKCDRVSERWEQIIIALEDSEPLVHGIWCYIIEQLMGKQDEAIKNLKVEFRKKCISYGKEDLEKAIKDHDFHEIIKTPKDQTDLLTRLIIERRKAKAERRQNYFIDHSDRLNAAPTHQTLQAMSISTGATKVKIQDETKESSKEHEFDRVKERTISSSSTKGTSYYIEHTPLESYHKLSDHEDRESGLYHLDVNTHSQKERPLNDLRDNLGLHVKTKCKRNLTDRVTEMHRNGNGSLNRNRESAVDSMEYGKNVHTNIILFDSATNDNDGLLIQLPRSQSSSCADITISRSDTSSNGSERGTMIRGISPSINTSLNGSNREAKRRGFSPSRNTSSSGSDREDLSPVSRNDHQDSITDTATATLRTPHNQDSVGHRRSQSSPLSSSKPFTIRSSNRDMNSSKHRSKCKPKTKDCTSATFDEDGSKKLPLEENKQKSKPSVDNSYTSSDIDARHTNLAVVQEVTRDLDNELYAENATLSRKVEQYENMIADIDGRVETIKTYIEKVRSGKDDLDQGATANPAILLQDSATELTRIKTLIKSAEIQNPQKNKSIKIKRLYKEISSLRDTVKTLQNEKDDFICKYQEEAREHKQECQKHKDTAKQYKAMAEKYEQDIAKHREVIEKLIKK